MSVSTGHGLTLSKVTHAFGAVFAAKDIDLDIRPGELVSLLGPSGCGKTTLLKIVAGFLRQSSGDVLVDGVSISDLPTSKRQIGIVFQNYALFPHMSVAENVGYGPVAAGRPKAEVGATVTEMLEIVQMAAFRDRLPRELSGGQQQRVALARCLAIRPRILLLDEPFSALDKNLRFDMQIEIKRLQRQSGITTVMVTHDQEEALGMSDRIAVLSRGHLEQFASPAEIYDRPASLFVNTFVGTANLIKGEVLDASDGRAVVRLAGGAVIQTRLGAGIGVGDRVLMAVRPEGLRLSVTPEAGTIEARITAVMPVGPALIYEVALADGTTLKVTRPRDASAPHEGTVYLFIEPAQVSGLFADPMAEIQ